MSVPSTQDLFLQRRKKGPSRQTAYVPPTNSGAGDISLVGGPPLPQAVVTPGQPNLSRAPALGSVSACGTGIVLNGQDENVSITNKDRERLQQGIRQMEAEQVELIPSGLLMDLFKQSELPRIAAVPITREDSTGPGSINDPQMGVIDNDKICPTCKGLNTTCEGHFGVLELQEMIYHPKYIKLIIEVLTSVCNDCGALLVPRDELEQMGLLRMKLKNRMPLIAAESKKRHCPVSLGLQAAAPPSTPSQSTTQMQQLLSRAGISAVAPQGTTKGCNKNPVYVSASNHINKIMIEQETGPGKKLHDPMHIGAIYKILDSISDETARTLGFTYTHPRDLIMQYLIVIPPKDRQPTIRDGETHPNPLTVWYQTIVKKNFELMRMKQANPDLREYLARQDPRRGYIQQGEYPIEVDPKKTNAYDALVSALASDIAVLFNNSKGIKIHNTKKLQGFQELLQGKEGMIRWLIQGKRVNFSARSVASPGPHLRLGEFGVPRIKASVLTATEIVNDLNIVRLRTLIYDPQNPNEPSHVNYITYGNGPLKGQCKRVLSDPEKRQKFAQALSSGDICERWLQDGDIVLFNRQPTLHKYSMMGARVKLEDTLSFRNHMGVTSALNLDFDGDEVNMHVVQGLMARAEVISYVNVTECIMDHRKSQPMIALVYDNLSAAYLLTSDTTTVTPTDFMQGLAVLTNTDSLTTLIERAIAEGVVPRGTTFKSVAPSQQEIDVLIRDNILDPGTTVEELFRSPELIERVKTAGRLEELLRKEFPGKLLFSALLPPDYTYKKAGIVIQNGILKSGVITKKHVGSSQGSIIQDLWNRYPNERVVDFITDGSFLLVNWLDTYGFSIGIDDCAPHDPERDLIVKKEIAKMRLAVRAMGEPPKEKMERKRYEQRLRAHVDVAKSIASRVATERLKPNNAMRISTESGAKGSSMNVAQTTTVIGQQLLFGERFAPKLSGGTRCTIWSSPNSLKPEDYGFICQSYIEGMGPMSMYFAAAAGREALMDASLKTASTGDLYNKAVKALDSVVVQYDGTVRNAAGFVYEFMFGDDNMDPAALNVIRTNEGDFPMFANIQDIANDANARYGY